MKRSLAQSRQNTGRMQVSFSRNAYIRLLLVPVFVYLVWILEVFLFEGHITLFQHPDPTGILLYTIVTCILVGLVVPVFIIRRTFILGDVNMFQIGFRSLRRTLLMVVLTTTVIWTAVILKDPFGTDRSAFSLAFLLLLPTGFASVMVCWVLIGTHVQAFVRSSGVLISISAGVIVTAILFGLTALAFFPGTSTPDIILCFMSAGVIAAICFYAVRDVWASGIMVTGFLVFLLAGQLEPALLNPSIAGISLSAAITLVALAAIHWYLSRNFMTIPAPVS